MAEESSTKPDPIIKFPKFIPHKGINTLEFESGYEEENVVGGINSNILMCTICRGMPRKPAAIKHCGHLYCESCIGHYFSRNRRPHSMFQGISIAPCPYCQKTFQAKDVQPYEKLSALARLMLNEKIVSCPNECGFRGTFHDVDTHQVYKCPRRIICCPNQGCNAEDTAQLIEEEHYPKCPHLRTHCNQCKLPVLVAERDAHNCIDAMHKAMQKCHVLMKARNIQIPDEARLGSANHTFTSESRYVRRKRLFPRMEIQDQMHLETLRSRHALDEAIAERRAQNAATNTHEGAEVVAADVAAAHFGNLWDRVISGDNEGSQNRSEDDFNFADHEQPADDNDSELTQAYSD